MDLSSITPLILTRNEEANIARTLERLAWASRIVVVDSGSTDSTLPVLATYRSVEIFSRSFDDHTTQWNFGLAQIRTDWVLALDADYILSEELVLELKELKPPDHINAFFIRFIYCVHGRPLRAALYPPRACLFRRSRCGYVRDGHTQLLQITGATQHLNAVIFHDDRKPLARWLDSQVRYSRIEAQHLLSLRTTQLKTVDRIRRKAILAPALIFIYTLVGKGLIFDGWPGWFYVLQRTYAEFLLSLHLLELKLRKRNSEKVEVSSEAVPEKPAVIRDCP